MKPEAIKRAMAAEEFDKAERLWSEYAEELRQSIEQGTSRAEALSEAAELLKWARWTVMVFRVQAGAQLAELRAAGQYGRESSAGSDRPAVDSSVGVVGLADFQYG